MMPMEMTRKSKLWVISFAVVAAAAVLIYVFASRISNDIEKYRLSHALEQPTVPSNPTLAENNATVNSSDNASVNIDVLKSSGIVKNTKYFLDVLGPATLHFTFTASGTGCVMGYGHDNAGIGYDVPLVGKFETTVNADVNTDGIYYAVCKNPDGSWGKYANVNVDVFDPKAYPTPSGTITKFLTLPGSGIKNPQ